MKPVCIALAALILCAGQARASVIAADFFDDASYSLGAQVYPDSDQDTGFGAGVGPDEGTGFTSGWQNPYYTAPRVIASPLSYAGLATQGFGAASPAYVACTYCVNSTALRTFSDNVATTDLWFSFLIRDDDAQDFTSYSNYGGIAIEDAANDSVYVGVPGLAVPTAQYSLQVGDSGGTTGVAQSAAAAAPGETALLVVDIRDDGEASLWVDPTVGAALGAPSATVAVPFAPSAGSYLKWSDSWGWTYGDLRVGTSLADVLPPAAPAPEPATWALLLAGFAALGARARARRGGAGSVSPAA